MYTNKPLLSVIVPIYNTEQYLKQCIDSIISQTYSNLEIILVDDGSTDGCGEICKLYNMLDSRVKVIQQKNQGAAVARRSGLEKATGIYAVFIDSDDYIEKDYFEKLLCTAENYDLVTTGIIIGQNDNELVFDVIEKGVYARKKKLDYIIDNMIVYKCGTERGLTPYVFNKLYRTDYAKKVVGQISEKVFWGEDSEFLYRYVLECNSINITNICGYHYCNREESIVHRRHKNYLTNLNELYISLEEAFCKHDKRDSLLLQLQIWISMMLKAAPSVMGFSDLTRILVANIFPFYEEMHDKEIILYGAGAVGREYYIQLRNRDDIKLAGWTDKNAEVYQKKDYPIVPLADAIKHKYDFIVIAVKDAKVMNEIKSELITSGVPENKIIWKAPIRLML